MYVLHVLHECTTCSACTTAHVQYTYVYTRSPHGYISKKLIYFHDSYSHKNTCTPIQVCAQHSIIIQVFSHISYLYRYPVQVPCTGTLYWYPVLVPCTGPNTVLPANFEKIFFFENTRDETDYVYGVPLQRYIINKLSLNFGFFINVFFLFPRGEIGGIYTYLSPVLPQI